MGVYVDDLIIIRGDRRDIDAFKKEMTSLFRMSNLGLLSYYLGIKVKQGKDEIKLSQSAYVQKLLEKGGMAECKPAQSPMEDRLKLSKMSTAAVVDATRYRSLVGGLRYLVHTRPDLVFAMACVSGSWRIRERITSPLSKGSYVLLREQRITALSTARKAARMS